MIDPIVAYTLGFVSGAISGAVIVTLSAKWYMQRQLKRLLA